MAAVISDGLGKIPRIHLCTVLRMPSSRAMSTFFPAKYVINTSAYRNTPFEHKVDLHRRYLAYSRSAFAGCDNQAGSTLACPQNLTLEIAQMEGTITKVWWVGCGRLPAGLRARMAPTLAFPGARQKLIDPLANAQEGVNIGWGRAHPNKQTLML